MRHAELKAGRPVYLIEVEHSWRQLSKRPLVCGTNLLGLIAQDLFLNDEVLANKVLDMYSLNPAHRGDKFDLFSDRKATKFAKYDLVGYNLDLKPSKECPVINFAELKEMLLS